MQKESKDAGGNHLEEILASTESQSKILRLNDKRYQDYIRVREAKRTDQYSMFATQGRRKTVKPGAGKAIKLRFDDIMTNSSVGPPTKAQLS